MTRARRCHPPTSKRSARLQARIAVSLAVVVLLVGHALADDPPARSPPTRILDTAGAVHEIAGVSSARACAIVFLGVECPISNRYVAELNLIARDAAALGVPLLGAISDPAVTRAAAVEHRQKLAIEFPVLFDASGDLAARLRPSHVPEAFVLDGAGAILYRGRIDDGWVELGRARATVTKHELRDAIAAAAAGRPIATPRTEAVGCSFGDAPPAAPTYARDVAPLLAAHCVECHHADAIGPFPLTTFSEARRHARDIALITSARIMPPWHAVAGRGPRFRDERQLSSREIERLAAWVASGTPAGDARDLPPAATFSAEWKLGEPDLVLEMPRAFEVPTSGRDVYRCFVVSSKQLPEMKIFSTLTQTSMVKPKRKPR